MQKLNITLPNNNNDKIVEVTSEDQFKQFLRDAHRDGKVVLGLYKDRGFAPIFLITLNDNDEYKVFFWSTSNTVIRHTGNLNDYNYIVIDKMDFN